MRKRRKERKGKDLCHFLCHQLCDLLRNYGLSPDKPYRNEKTGSIIRVGVLIAKEGNRGRKTYTELLEVEDRASAKPTQEG